MFSPPPQRYVLVTRRRIGWLLICGGAAVFLWWLFFGGVFAVSEFRCQQANAPCNQAIQAELDRLKGKSMLTTRWDPVGEKLERADPAILKVHFTPHLPNAIEVRIEIREPEVRLRKTSSQNALVADQEGFVFALATEIESSLPEIVSEEVENIEIGKIIENPRIRNAVKLAVLLRENFISFQRILVDREGIMVLLTDGTPALFSEEGDFIKEVTTLQRILSQATIDHRPTKIDVRYSKPVLSY